MEICTWRYVRGMRSTGSISPLRLSTTSPVQENRATPETEGPRPKRHSPVRRASPTQTVTCMWQIPRITSSAWSTSPPGRSQRCLGMASAEMVPRTIRSVVVWRDRTVSSLSLVTVCTSETVRFIVSGYCSDTIRHWAPSGTHGATSVRSHEQGRAIPQGTGPARRGAIRRVPAHRYAPAERRTHRGWSQGR